MTISNKIKMAAAAGVVAGAAALFAPAGVAFAQPQGIIGGSSATLINPTAEELLIFGQYGTVRNDGGGQYTIVLTGANPANPSAPTWFQVIQANSEEFAAIGIENNSQTPPYSAA